MRVCLRVTLTRKGDLSAVPPRPQERSPARRSCSVETYSRAEKFEFACQSPISTMLDFSMLDFCLNAREMCSAIEVLEKWILDFGMRTRIFLHASTFPPNMICELGPSPGLFTASVTRSGVNSICVTYKKVRTVTRCFACKCAA